MCLQPWRPPKSRRRARARPVRGPGLAHRRGADARVHERRGARAHPATAARLHFWSRSRDELWHKGATSGNTQAVKALRYDCDADAILALVEPAGPACHTGERTCFHNGELEPARRTRRCPRSSARSPPAHDRRPAGSYTAELLADPALIGAKVQEEAEEVARAAREESDERVAEEAADVLYHLTVLLHSRGLEPRRPRAGTRWPSPLTHNVIPLGGPSWPPTPPVPASPSSRTPRRRSPRS